MIKCHWKKVELGQVREAKQRNKNNINYLDDLPQQILKWTENICYHLLLLTFWCGGYFPYLLLLLSATQNLLWVTVATILLIFIYFIILCWAIKNLFLHKVSIFFVFVINYLRSISITEAVARRSSAKAVLKIQRKFKGQESTCSRAPTFIILIAVGQQLSKRVSSISVFCEFCEITFEGFLTH